MTTKTAASFPFNLYHLYARALNFVQPVFLLAIRLFWGWQFIETGWGKWHDIPKVIGFFTQIGIPFPAANAYLVATIELCGGALLLLGLASRLITVPLVVSMIVAYATTEQDALHALAQGNTDPFFNAAPFLFLAASLIVLIFGPGKISLDYLLFRKADPSLE